MLTLVDVAKENKVIKNDRFSRTNKNLSQLLKSKNLIILSNIKVIRFLILKASTVFFLLRQVVLKLLFLRILIWNIISRLKLILSAIL